MFDARITLTTRSPPPTRSGANWYPTPTGQYVTSVTPDSVTFVGDHYDVAYTPQAAGNYSVSPQSQQRLCFQTKRQSASRARV